MSFFNKLKDYSWRSYRYMKEKGFEGNFYDYKNFEIENESKPNT